MSEKTEQTRTPFSLGEADAAFERARQHMAKALARPEVQDALKTYREKAEQAIRARNLKRA